MNRDARTTCPHGISEFTYCGLCDTDKHREELRIGQFRAAFPGVEEAATQRKERRAEWIRNNVVHFFSRNNMESSVEMAEYMADELIKRGYL